MPDIYDVSLSSSFGYKDQPTKATKKPVGPPSSYDNPISSFDAPIYDENSYTAEAVSKLIILDYYSVYLYSNILIKMKHLKHFFALKVLQRVF